jgi:hypothetical protein
MNKCRSWREAPHEVAGPSCNPVHPARRGTTISGRSPGFRIDAFRLPSQREPVARTADRSPVTVAGAARAFTRFPLRPGPRSLWLRTTRDVRPPLAAQFRKCKMPRQVRPEPGVNRLTRRAACVPDRDGPNSGAACGAGPRYAPTRVLPKAIDDHSPTLHFFP